MSLDIYTMYEKDRRIKTGNAGTAFWDAIYSPKGLPIRPCDYGDYVLQKRRMRKR